MDADVGVLLPNRTDGRVEEVAAEAETLGYDAIWAGELWGEDAFVRLGLAAGACDLRLGTAIANVFSRTPATLAMAAATLADASGERFRLGVGPSTPTAIENVHGLTYERPVRHVRETVEIVSRLVDGDGRVSYEGEILSVSGVPALSAPVHAYNAALGPANRRVTGRYCDGWLPHNVPFPRLAEAFEPVAEAAREAGRDPDELTVAPYVPAAASEDRAAARALLRGHVAYYVGSGEGYRRAVAAAFPEAEEIAEAWRAGERDRARQAVTEEMIDALGAAGTPEEVRERFEEIASLDAVDEPILVVPESADREVRERTIEALAPDA